jgi:hypothetical protein
MFIPCAVITGTVPWSTEAVLNAVNTVIVSETFVVQVL